MNIKINANKRLFLGVLIFIALIFIILVPKISLKEYRTIKEYISQVEKTKSFKYYNLAENKILKVKDKRLRAKLQSELGQYSSEVYREDINNALYWFGELWAKNDLWAYDILRTYLIPYVESEEDRNYLQNELIGWGQSRVFTEGLTEALEALNKAWIDKSYIKEAEKKIVNNLSYENPWTMAYLEGQLNMIKEKNTEKQQILIVGDSITLAMGAEYVGDSPRARVESSWWNRMDNSKYEFSTMAVGGMGIVQRSITNGIELVKFVESSSKPAKSYDKILIALSSNDGPYSPEEYKKGLTELIKYLKSKYSAKEWVFINFHNFPKEMEQVAKEEEATFIDVDMDNIHKFNKEKDNIHPSVKGHEQIYDIVSKALKVY